MPTYRKGVPTCSTNAMSRSQIDRLTRRIEALQAQRKPPEQRIFTLLVRNHMRTRSEDDSYESQEPRRHTHRTTLEGIPPASRDDIARACRRRPRNAGANQPL